MRKFEKIMPNDLLDGLPSMRDIQYHINLILGASLPNLTHYRMSPKDHEIFQGKVKDLIKKEMVRESMSPCVVLALFTPKKGESWRLVGLLTKNIVKYRFSILHLYDMLERSQIFTKIDLKSEYHQIHIKLGDE